MAVAIILSVGIRQQSSNKSEEPLIYPNVESSYIDNINNYLEHILEKLLIFEAEGKDRWGLFGI